MSTAEPGDRIRLITHDGATFEGILMPRHSFSGADIVTLKLDNGYNVGLADDGAKTEPRARYADDAGSR